MGGSAHDRAERGPAGTSWRRRAEPAERGGAMTEQLGLFAAPTRLFMCTPSKLAAYEDCPRRYRHAYLDRPTPQKGPPWAHNSLGASVHTALRNWYALPPERRVPAALPSLLQATWVSEGYRDDAQERAVFRRALQWLESYLAEVDPRVEPVGVERVVASRTPALYAYAAERVFRRRCRRVELHHLPSGTVAGHEHTEESLARHLRRAEDAARNIIAAEQALAAGADPDTTFPTAPSPGCAWCDFRRVCPAGAEAPRREPWAGLWAEGSTGEDAQT